MALAGACLLDQSDNAEQVTRQNAVLEGVAERVELRTADMRQLPFDDGSFDVVVSSLAIHYVPGAGERAKALREAARVLKKGGKLAIADIRHTYAYASELEACGLDTGQPNVERCGGEHLDRGRREPAVSPLPKRGGVTRTARKPGHARPPRGR